VQTHLTPKFCAKIGGIQTIQMSSTVAYYLRFEVHKMEVCHDDKTTGSIGDAT
jgi:hypothetical protein